MQKDITVLIVCSLILFADVLSFWHVFIASKLSPVDHTGIAALLILIINAALFVQLNYLLIRRIIDRQFNQN